MTNTLTTLGFQTTSTGLGQVHSATVGTMNPSTPNPVLDMALEAHRKGYGTIPIKTDSKVPALAWKQFQTMPPSEEQLGQLFADARQNIALLTTNLVIFDCDDPAMAKRVLTESGDTPYRVQTPRGGIHLAYRLRRGIVLSNHVNVKGLKIDIRTTGGLALLPPSRTDQGEYRWLGEGLPLRQELPFACIGWTRARKRHAFATVFDVTPTDAGTRARAYLAKIEPAISGQHGHSQCFKAACVLVQKFSLTYEQAWPLLVEWNEHNLPPFTERELEHKLRDAIKKIRH